MFFELIAIFVSVCSTEWRKVIGLRGGGGGGGGGVVGPPIHQRTNWGWSHSSRFGDEPKTHPFPLPKDFSTPFFAPKFSPPTYLPPLLPPSPHFSLTPSRELSRPPKLETHRTSWHKAWGRWKAQCWRNMERRRQEERFIPNAEVREQR